MSNQREKLFSKFNIYYAVITGEKNLNKYIYIYSFLNKNGIMRKRIYVSM